MHETHEMRYICTRNHHADRLIADRLSYRVNHRIIAQITHILFES